MVLWLTVMVAAPVWIEVRIGATFPPLSVVFLMMIPAVVYAADARVTKTDLLIFGFTIFAAVATFFADTPMYAFTTVLVQWLPAYFIGRHLAPAAGMEWTYRAVAFASGIVGLWAVGEFIFGLHVFQHFAGTTSSGGWQAIQVRGPYARSEGAFGHSIALGGFLSIGLPFIIGAKFKPLQRMFLLIISAAGLIVTFSRGPLVGGLIVVILGVMFMTTESMSRRLRGWMLGLLVVAGFTVLPLLFGLFDTLSYDTKVSTGYRTLLFQTILQDMHPLGTASGFGVGPGGKYFYWDFSSIDNAYVLAVLQYGWLPVVFLLAGLIALMVRVLIKRQCGPADIALIGQIWVMSTVALITQYGMAVWFCAGMTVAFGVTRARINRSHSLSLPEWGKSNGYLVPR